MRLSFRVWMNLLVLILVVVFTCAVAYAKDGINDQPDYTSEVMMVLVNLLVLSVVFEVAYNVLFNWKWFLPFDGIGLKTPLVLAGAAIFVFVADIDFIQKLLIAMEYIKADAGPTPAGKWITALLLTGGSSGIVTIFSRLGIRNPVERMERVEQAKKAAGK